MKKEVVSFHYTLKDKTGKVIESSRQSTPVTYLEGSGQIIPGLESVMNGLNVGDQKEIFVKSKDAYGSRQDDLIVQVPKDHLPEGVAVGNQFRQDTEDGHTHIFTVTKVAADHAVLDGNHPLAGQDLTFDVEIVERRAATKEELEHGHAHGADGHHH